MKKIPIKNKVYGLKYALVDDEDYDLLIKIKWYLKTDIRVTGRVVHYAFSTIGFMHRIILNMTSKDKEVVDHINHNQLDNTKSNLRRCSHSVNNKNIYGGIKVRRNINEVWFKDLPDGKIKVTLNLRGYPFKTFKVNTKEEAEKKRKELIEKFIK